MEDEKKGLVSLLNTDYCQAVADGWNFYGDHAEAFTSRKNAINHANTLLSSDYETGILKSHAFGLVLHVVGIREYEL